MSVSGWVNKKKEQKKTISGWDNEKREQKKAISGWVNRKKGNKKKQSPDGYYYYITLLKVQYTGIVYCTYNNTIKIV
jgi:hypothetical protein